MLAGLFFKTRAVPAQFWVPDVADGTSAPAAAYVTTIPKIGGIAALFRLMDGPLQHVDVDWRLLLAIIAAASMTLGNFAAFFQDAPRRLLGYSTISHVEVEGVLPSTLKSRFATCRRTCSGTRGSPTLQS